MSLYDAFMPSMQTTTIRFSSIQTAQIQKLSRKLGLKKSDVIRFAIARLAEQEGVGTPAK